VEHGRHGALRANDDRPPFRALELHFVTASLAGNRSNYCD